MEEDGVDFDVQDSAYHIYGTYVLSNTGHRPKGSTDGKQTPVLPN